MKLSEPRKKIIPLHLFALFVCVSVGAFLAYHLGQDLSWDSLNYHWYNPWAFLHHRLLYDVQPAGAASFYNPILDLPAYLLRTHLRPVIAGILLGGIQGINGWLVFEIAQNLLKGFFKGNLARLLVSLAIGMMSLFGAATLSELGNSMGDDLVSLFVLGALLLVLLSFDESNKSNKARRLRICGYFLVGIASGLKLTSLVYAIPLLICGMFIIGNYKEKIIQSVWHFIAFIAGVLASAGYWYFELWRNFGSPIFPYYNAVFKSPFFPKVNYSEGIWVPSALLTKVFYPFTLLSLPTQADKLYFRDPRLAVLFVLLLVFVGYWLIQKLIFKKLPRLNVSRKEVAFLAFIVMSYILWQKEFFNYRYLVPIELVSLVAIALLVYKLIANTKLATAIIILLAGLITAFTVPLNWYRIPWQPYNFGPNLYAQLSHIDGTVLFSPNNPLGFLGPYLPDNDRAISISSYDSLTSDEKKLVTRDIRTDESNHKQFYGVETSNGDEIKYYQEVGFYNVNNQCLAINTYAGKYLFNGALNYKICKLSENQINNKSG